MCSPQFKVPPLPHLRVVGHPPDCCPSQPPIPASLVVPAAADDYWMTTDGCFTSGNNLAAQSRVGRTPLAVRCCDGQGACHSNHSGACFPSSATHLEAEEACAAQGMRLCTLTELESKVCCGTGCGYDDFRVWSSMEGVLMAFGPCSCSVPCVREVL